MGRLGKGGLQDTALAWQPQTCLYLLDSSIQVLDLHIAWLKQSLAANIFSFWKAPWCLIPPFPYPLSLSILYSPPLLFPSLARSTLGSVVFSSLPLCQYLSGFLLVGHPLISSLYLKVFIHLFPLSEHTFRGYSNFRHEERKV